MKDRASMGDYSPAHDVMLDVQRQIEIMKGLERRDRKFSWANGIMTGALIVVLILLLSVG